MRALVPSDHAAGRYATVEAFFEKMNGLFKLLESFLGRFHYQIIV